MTKRREETTHSVREHFVKKEGFEGTKTDKITSTPVSPEGLIGL